MEEEAGWWKISFPKLSVNYEKFMRQFHPQTQAIAVPTLDSRLQKALSLAFVQLTRSPWDKGSAGTSEHAPLEPNSQPFPHPLSLPISTAPFHPSTLNYTLGIPNPDLTCPDALKSTSRACKFLPQLHPPKHRP